MTKRLGKFLIIKSFNSNWLILIFSSEIKKEWYLSWAGTESDIPTSGLKPELDNFDYTKEQSEEGYKNFTVIQCKIKSIEWLYLAAKGHRRAKFDLENNKDNWLIP